MYSSVKKSIVTALVGTLFGTAVLADDRRFEFDVNAGFTAQYDTNVAIVELDSSAGEADVANVFDAGIGTKARIGRGLQLRLGYDYSGTRYREFADFDLDLHHGHASLSMQKGPTESSVAVDRFEGVLAGQDYLVQTQISPSISRLFGTRWYLRGAYTRADKSFETLEDRNATSDALRADAYLLFDGMDHYVAASVQSQKENARSTDYTFDSVMGQLSWGYHVELPATEIMLKTQLRFEERDYGAVMPASASRRVDDRHRASIAASIPLSEHFSVEASVDHTRNTSELADANLERTVYAMKFSVEF